MIPELSLSLLGRVYDPIKTAQGAGYTLLREHHSDNLDIERGREITVYEIYEDGDIYLWHERTYNLEVVGNTVMSFVSKRHVSYQVDNCNLWLRHNDGFTHADEWLEYADRRIPHTVRRGHFLRGIVPLISITQVAKDSKGGNGVEKVKIIYPNKDGREMLVLKGQGWSKGYRNLCLTRQSHQGMVNKVLRGEKPFGQSLTLNHHQHQFIYFDNTILFVFDLENQIKAVVSLV